MMISPHTILDKTLERKGAFLGTFFIVFLVTYLFFVAIDFLPEEKKAEIQAETEVVAPSPVETEDKNVLPSAVKGSGLLPTEIHIKKLDRTITVFNPTSRAIADLDAALLNGVVRHPDSATLADDSNVFILGHSSYLPNVVNKNFQAFNGLQDLAWGDTIEVTTDGYVFVYEVEKVYKAKAADVTVPIEGTGPRLTLATCNSFGSKDDRFIVEAKRVEIRTI